MALFALGSPNAELQQGLTAKQSIAQENVETRLDAWRAAAQLAAERPVLGLGPGNFGFYYFEKTGRPPGTFSGLRVVHDAYLDVAAELGVTGLLLFVGYLALVFQRAHGVARQLARSARPGHRRTRLAGRGHGRRVDAVGAVLPAVLGARSARHHDLGRGSDRPPRVARDGPVTDRRRFVYVSTLDHGGPLSHLRDLVPRVAAGADVRVVCATDAIAAAFGADGVPAEVLEVRSKWDVLALRRLWRLLADADVVHTQDRRAGFFARPLARLRGAVVVHTYHGLPEDLAVRVGRAAPAPGAALVVAAPLSGCSGSTCPSKRVWPAWLRSSCRRRPWPTSSAQSEFHRDEPS